MDTLKQSLFTLTSNNKRRRHVLSYWWLHAEKKTYIATRAIWAVSGILGGVVPLGDAGRYR